MKQLSQQLEIQPRHNVGLVQSRKSHLEPNSNQPAWKLGLANLPNEHLAKLITIVWRGATGHYSAGIYSATTKESRTFDFLRFCEYLLN